MEAWYNLVCVKGGMTGGQSRPLCFGPVEHVFNVPEGKHFENVLHQVDGKDRDSPRV